MRLARLALIVVLALTPLVVTRAQTGQRGAQPPTPPPPGGPPGQPATPGQRGGGGGRGRGAIASMTMSSPAWPDGASMPRKYTQAGEDVSPPLSWSGAPDGTVSFVLMVHDLDAPLGADDLLHWLVWNIPGAATGLPEQVPQGSTLPDGTRQISATGPTYRGPGALAAGPVHHYVFELFALDAVIDVPAVGASPPQTRAAVIAAMAGHVRGKAVCVGLYKRSS
jgi:Raf kinase inhibitor-like YbhB/YbcL family protein